MNTFDAPATRGQRLAQAAWQRIERRARSVQAPNRKEYSSFAKRFPSLIHSCGLAQALAFAQAKAPDGYLDDLAAVLSQTDRAEWLKQAREAEVPAYIRSSREALAGAGWLKRYAEAVLDEEEHQRGGEDAGVQG